MIKEIAKLMIVSLAIITLLPLSASASNFHPTSRTITKTINGDMGVAQDAYIPTGNYTDLGLKKPSDMSISNNKMYIADTGNKRVVIVDLKTSEVKIVGLGLLVAPSGIAVGKDGKIFVADAEKSEAYRFSSSGVLELTFVKPTMPSFGKQAFKPKKIAVADDGGAYIISEGSTAGIVHMNGKGEFLGYFTSNDVSVSISEKLQDIFLTNEQKSNFLKKVPPSFGGIFRGSDGLVYTTNKGKGVNIKKHAISGYDLFKDGSDKIPLQDPADNHVTEDGRMFILQGNGFITELTSDGDLIATFGGNSGKTDRIGLFEVPCGIGVDSNNNIYVLDGQREYVQIFSPTPTQNDVHQALNDYNNGNYDSSKKQWTEVLTFNNTSFLAQVYLGRCYMQEGNYAKAEEHFKIADVKSEYSEAYWEIRNVWLQKNLGFVLIFIIFTFISYSILKIVNKKTGFLKSLITYKGRILENKLVYDLSKIKYAMLHPIDNAYYVKVKQIGSCLSATIIYAALFIIFISNLVYRGFIFSIDIANFSVTTTFIYFVVILGLFIVGNYFISSINDGNGTLRTIYVSIAYCFSPIILFIPFVILFSNVATTNEGFLIAFASFIILVWCIVNIFITLIEIHDYTFKQTVGNVLITFFFMGVCIIGASVGYLLFNQVKEFVLDIITEVMLRGKAT